MAGRALADREVERDALLSTDTIRRQHVDDGPHARGLPRRGAEWQADAVPDEIDEDVLAQIGIPLDGPKLGELQAACAMVARRIHADKLRVIGFVPSDDRIAVPPVAIHLGLALCNLTGATVAVVDANVRYPALAGISRGTSSDHDDSVFATRWLRGSLALLTPPRVER